jgi:hypothetical protein
MPGVLRRLLICLAFAIWCFLNTWVEFGEGKSVYFARYDPIRGVVISVICWEVILAAGMFGLWEICRKRRMTGWRPLHLIFLASCFAPLGIAAVAALRASPVNLKPVVRNPWFWPVVLVLFLAPLAFALMRPYSASRLMQGIFLYSWPVLMVVQVQAARRTLIKYSPASYADRPPATALNSQPSHVRVVWIIFDELSQTIAFAKRPAGLQLPNLDQMRAQSFYASSAEAPPGDSTELCMPSLILGERVVDDIPDGPENLFLRTISRPEAFQWSMAPNVFDTARALGFNTGLVGWFLPYGRLLNRSLTKCYWTAGWLPSGIEERFKRQSLVGSLWDRARLQFYVLPLAGRLPSVSPAAFQRQEKIEKFSYLLDRAQEIVTDPSVGLALIHLPVPHPPAIYNQSGQEMASEGRIGYVDNVALADRTLGVLRRCMEQAGLWERTAILLSADHGWRTYIWRGSPDWTADEEAASHEDTSGVPFLLKLPGQTSGLQYGKRFSTMVTRRLITDILSDRLIDPSLIPNVIERFEAHLP